ncbi:PREDICTED: uncharacterized protein CG7065-like isoform X2 [Dinoponera quadriceps]|nr:PREDICTED: uncharacterized protein CG7065-like isoform X2 [Dinoponera quadriceps]
MQNFDDLDIEGLSPSHQSEEDKEKEEHERKRIMRCSVTAEDGALKPVYSETEDSDIWCHICNVALYGAHKLISHNQCNRHKMKLDEWPYPVMLWSKRPESKTAAVQSTVIGDALAPGEPVPPGTEDQITRTTSIQMSLDRHQSSPLVGLEYLLELVDNESCEPSYTCVLCDKRGDPRTVMAHITSYNHRITYLNRHFPTISRAITELPRTPNYKRGANEISVLVAKKIEEKFGRMKPQLVEKSQFEKSRMQYIKRVYQDVHFRETPECTFMEVYDVKWVTNFDEKMAELNGNNVRKKDPQPTDGKADNKHKKEDKKEKSPKKVEPKGELTKSGFKIRMFTKDKTSLRKPASKAEESAKKTPKRPSDDTKSLSSLSSISSSPSPSRSKSRSPVTRNRRRHSAERSVGGRYHRSGSRHSRERHLRPSRERARGRSRSRSRSPQPPLRERDKWDKYREQIRRAEETLERALKFHEKNPEKHPSYPDEWKKFWNRRYKELQAEGSDPSKHDFKPEWIEFWNKRMREIHNEQLQQRKEEIRKRLELPEDKPPEKWTPARRERSSPVAKRPRHRADSDDEVEYVGTKMIKPEYYERHEALRERDYAYPSYSRGRGAGYSHPYYPRTATRVRPIHFATPYPVKDDSPAPSSQEETLTEDLEVVGLLRLLTALEGQLGSLGPKIVSLLSKALAAEKAKPNSAEELLFDEEVSVIFETVKEKLKGQLFAGMVEKMAVSPTKTAIQNIAKLLHKASESKKKLEEEKRKLERELLPSAKPVASYIAGRAAYSRPVEIVAPAIKSEPVSVPGVGTVDKVAIAQEIAAALVAQGKSNVSQEDLETLINAVVGMAEASKLSDKPVTTADFVKGLASCSNAARSTVEKTVEPNERQSQKVEDLSDADLKSMLQNFKELSTPEQHNLIGFLKKLEASDPSRVEKLRAFVNLGTSSSVMSTSGGRLKSPTPEVTVEAVTVGKSRKSVSPFSIRKSNQNPTDEEDKWKPKLDMFANDDDEEPADSKKTKDNDNEKTAKTKIDLSDDDDDYTFEDIYKAADKNVSENEKAKKKTSRAFSKSWSRSRSRSRSKSRSPPRPKETASRTNDPNAILNETKRLIANIMGDLPNKFVTKLHGGKDKLDSLPSAVDQQQQQQQMPSVAGGFYNPMQQPPFAPSGNQPRPPGQTITYPNVPGSQQFPSYQQQPQMFPNNSGYMDNSYNYQGYGNMSGQYGAQYSQQSSYGSYAPPPAAHTTPGYTPPSQTQQYDSYMQQPRFY